MKGWPRPLLVARHDIIAAFIAFMSVETPLRLFKDIVELSVGELVGGGLHLHAQMDLLLWNITGNPAEYLVVAIIQDSDAVRQIILESHRSILQSTECDEFSGALDLMPIHAAGEALVTISPGREENHPTVFASGSHNLALLQIVDEVIDFGDRCEAYGSKFLKTIIDLFCLAHFFISPKW
jgi:hypothetical protein